jgi:hypothetical protein
MNLCPGYRQVIEGSTTRIAAQELIAFGVSFEAVAILT